MRVQLLALSLAACGLGASRAEPVPAAASAGMHVATSSARTVMLNVSGHAVAVHTRVPAAPEAAVLLVHGRTWSGLPDFDLQVPGESLSLMDNLADAGFAVYAIDLRGYGATARDASGWNTPDKAVDDVRAAAAEIARRHGFAPSVLGWSYGSMVAQLLAQRHPEAVDAIVLYGYPRDPDATGGQSPAQPERRKTTREAAAEDFIVPGAISAQASAAFVDAAVAADPIRADWNELETWAELDPARVGVPTLVVHGERDPYAPQAHMAKLFSRLATADKQWVVLPGMDHAAHLERGAARFLVAVTAFLRRDRGGVR